MFEKSLYDLIRGMRSHKGNERAYILDSLKECRNEAKSQDLDIKATAILKLIYLDMFGHDMAWASFHALEVMSSPKFRQKRVGYLAAVQSFRIDTDVLMLTTNLIKKDLTSGSVPEMSLAINGLSHIASPSLARDLAPDLVAKLTHSSPNIRKKAVLVLYKCFLQSPELLRTSWPRLRECLNDEDTSVVSATVNIICELARRNPKNYLPLAPQLFKLLTNGNNNWMTIKLIKLFATLTPLEPRLIKKLIPPITNIIQTTPAMSLLYECISGLISGGLLSPLRHSPDSDELALVCVTKLRGFLTDDGDSNLKYVGLLAMTKLVATHPHLVAQHQDVILNCIDDADITIRYRALELVVGMVDEQTLPGVVGRLMRQLKPRTGDEREMVELEAAETAEEDEDMQEEVMRQGGQRTRGQVVALELPDDYKRCVIERVVQMCSRDMYVNVGDFEWYLDVLIQLVRYAPPVQGVEGVQGEEGEAPRSTKDVGEDIGRELRNVAVRVKSVRPEAVRCAEVLLSRRDGVFPAAGGGGLAALGPAAWVAGEYSSLLSNPDSTFDSLLSHNSLSLPPQIQIIYLQSIAKIYTRLTSSSSIPWTPSRKSTLHLLTTRLLSFLTPLSHSPHLEVQERAVEFLELFRVSLDAIAAQPVSTDTEDYDPPPLLTDALPALFPTSTEPINPVAPGAQRKVPPPPTLDLADPINPDLISLIASADFDPALQTDPDDDAAKFHRFYYDKPKSSAAASLRPATHTIDDAVKAAGAPQAYQSVAEDEYLDPDILARRKRERAQRNRDDPFYIFSPGDAVDEEIDQIPIMELKLDDAELAAVQAQQEAKKAQQQASNRRRREKVEIAGDEVVEGVVTSDDEAAAAAGKPKKKTKKGLLQMADRGLEGLSLDEDGEEREKAEEERARRRAKREVERLRREMEESVRKEKEERERAEKEKEVKAKAEKKKKKVKAKKAEEGGETGEGAVKTKKKKKVKKSEGAGEGVEAEGEGEGEKKKKVKKVKKKKTVVAAEGEGEAAVVPGDS